MLKDTLIRALTAYKIELYSNNKENTDLKIKQIDSCQDYINRENEINGTWLTDNYSILFRAVKYHLDLKKLNGEDKDEDYLNLNKCISFYENIFKNIDVDLLYCEKDM
ncbi:MAG: hypothetical protein IJ279_06320 [Clostridia bacterium]|nr:hypothetical protein [Clostridia bacterium]